MAFLWLHQKNALRLQHNVFHLIFSRNICRESTAIVSVLLMELKSIASKWKNNIVLISLVMGILYNRSIISSTTVVKWKKILWMVFYPGEQQRSRVVREGFETYVHLIPFFGLN